MFRKWENKTFWLVIIGKLFLENAIEHFSQGVVGFGRRQIDYVPVEPLSGFLVGSGPAANPSADREAHKAAPEPKRPPLLRADSRRGHRGCGGGASGRVGPKKLGSA